MIYIDRPALRWYENGNMHPPKLRYSYNLHSDCDSPAVKWRDGTKEWWVNGVRHRKDGAAIIWSNGDQEWWVNGNRHRTDGPAVIFVNSKKEWWVEGKLHREDGPAVVYDRDSQEWWLNGLLHRVDGPAIIWSNGDQDWAINGKIITDDVNKWMKSNKYKWKLNSPWDKERIAEFLLSFSQ